MSESLDLISSLFAATPDAPIPVAMGDGQLTAITDADFFDTHSGELSVSPLTETGVAFFFGVMADVDEDAYLTCRLKPTAALYKDGTMIVCWALDRPANTIEAAEIADALGMEGFDEPIPVPPTGNWKLIYADPSTFYILADLLDAYCPAAQELTATAQALNYGDALILRPYDENDPIYQQEIIWMVGGNKESKNWKQQKDTVAGFIAKLAVHRVEKKKDGVAFVFADMVPGQRLKNSVKALHAVGLDIDTGTPSSVVDASLDALGVCAVRYTTHSHGKTRTEFKKDKIVKFAPDQDIDTALIQRFLREVERWDESIVETADYGGTDHTDKGIVVSVSHAGMPKHRIVVPFATPFVIADEGQTQVKAMEKWTKVPTALAEKLGVPIDKTGTDPSRLFYPPRHAEGAPFEISLFGGPLFDWRALELDNPFDQLAAEATKGTGKSVTEEGRKLGRWSMKRAHGFQIADVVESFATDRIRGNASQGFDIECPFDENHSNSGDRDDRACFVVNAGDGQSEFFTISCRHQSCRDKTNLDMLGKMLKDGWFPKEALEDEQYNAVVLEGEAPQPEVTKRLEREDEAKEKYIEAIDTLTSLSNDDEFEKVANLVIDAVGSSHLARDRALERISKCMDWKITSVKKAYAECEKARNKESTKTGSKTDELGRLIFPYSGEYNFDEATAMCFRALKKSNEKAKEPSICHIDGDPVRLVRDMKAGVEKAKFRHIETKALWSELNKLITFVRRTEQAEGGRGCVPREVADHVYEQCYGELVSAPEVLYTPLFLADGALMLSAGYHYRPSPQPRGEPLVNILMIHNDLKVPDVPEDPSAEEVEEAINWIKLELLSDFPFLDYDAQGNERREPSEANALAMLITPFMRRMIHGRTPVFFVSKPKAGTGGTLIGKLPMLLFDGAAGAATRYSQNEEEMQKGLIAAVQEQRSHLFFDDVKDFNNRELLRAITQDYVGGRLLGSSRNIEVPNRFNWIGTGNNTIIQDEMRRRIAFIRMNAKLPDIQSRQFRHPDVSGFGYEEFVRNNRAVAIRHILTIIQYWISTGCEPFTDRRRASFEEWSAKVGGVLQACGIEGFLDNLSTIEQDMDEVSSRQFVREMLLKFSVEHPQKPQVLFNWAVDRDLDICEGNNDDQKKSRFMKRLPMLDGQTFAIDDNNYMVQRRYDKDGDVAFQLTKVEHATLEIQEPKAAA